MSTSDLYHMQGIYWFGQEPGTRYVGDTVIFKISPRDNAIKCPHCQAQDVHVERTLTRVFKGIPIGNRKAVLFEAKIPVVHCYECGKYGRIDTGFSLPKKHYTKGFAKNAVALATQMSVAAVANYLEVSWHTIDDILKDYLEKKYSTPNLKNVTRISIDETAIGKGHNYLTVVMDLDTREPIFVGKGKGEEALVPFWKLLGNRKKKIEVVAIDMGTAYQSAVRNNIPQASIVFDRFHVVKLMNQKLDELRRQVFASAPKAEKDVIKGCRYLLLKNDDNLDPTRDEKERLDKVLALNTPLTAGYMFKESLRQFWTKGFREEAEATIRAWICSVRSSGVRALITMANTVERYIEGILNYYDHGQVTSAAIESLNNGIKVLIRKAYGFRNMKKFRLMILGIREFNPNKMFAPG
jgi:transposase